MEAERTVRFTLGGMLFEYDEKKNKINIRKHGISFRSAARVFFDYDRIELYDDENSIDEDRYDTIGDTSAGKLLYANSTVIGNVFQSLERDDDILFVVYTERRCIADNGHTAEVTRLISARMQPTLKGGSTMENMNDLSRKQLEELAFTEVELKELENARKRPITFDDDCPETTPERALRFKRVNPPRHAGIINPA